MIIIWWAVAFYLYLLLHEFAGHYLANLLSGIPMEQMKITWEPLLNINMFPYRVTVINGKVPRISYFAGGFMSGLLLLLSVFLFLRIYRKNKQERFWWFFATTLCYALAGFIEFVIEGFFTKYHSGALEMLIMSLSISFFLLLLVGLHYRHRIIPYLRNI